MERIKILVDGMGGDNAPLSVVEGSIDAVRENENIEIVILGDESVIKQSLSDLRYDGDAIKVHNTTEVIETAEHPVHAIRSKKDSSLVVGMKMLREGEGDAFVSAGNSGAILVGAQTIVGRLKGIKNTPMAVIIPTLTGKSLLLDAGARVDIGAETLVQYAILGKAYIKAYFDIENPTIGILNIGAEEEKGNALVQEAFPLLKNKDDLNFIGSVEARDVPCGGADVIVAEGFAGNICLKSMEGTISTLMKLIKTSLMGSLKSKIGALLIKDSLKTMLKSYDASKYGGAPLLGCKSIALKVHGNAKKSEITATILQGAKLASEDFVAKLNTALGN